MLLQLATYVCVDCSNCLGFMAGWLKVTVNLVHIHIVALHFHSEDHCLMEAMSCYLFMYCGKLILFLNLSLSSGKTVCLAS